MIHSKIILLSKMYQENIPVSQKIDTNQNKIIWSPAGV